MINKASVLALSTVLIGSVFSSVASATPSNGNITFTFSGNVPALPIGGTGWSFYNADGTPYTAPSAISLNSSDSLTGVQLIANSEDFYVKPNDGAGNLTASSNITALLLSRPTISGTAVKAAQLDDVVSDITINGVSLPVGSVPEIVSVVPNATAEGQRMSLGAQVNIPNSARNADGGDIRIIAAIRMSADITAP